MMRLEFIGGRSSKHWSAEQIGASVVFRWGRIGQPEQKAVKSFASVETAAAELQRRQREKLRKGYQWRTRDWAQLWLPFASHAPALSSPSALQLEGPFVGDNC